MTRPNDEPAPACCDDCRLGPWCNRPKFHEGTLDPYECEDWLSEHPRDGSGSECPTCGGCQDYELPNPSPPIDWSKAIGEIFRMITDKR